MPRFAAIDVGSNAMRLQIAQATDPQRISIFRSERVPVRLGHSVFQTGSLDPAVIDFEPDNHFADSAVTAALPADAGSSSRATASNQRPPDTKKHITEDQMRINTSSKGRSWC